MSKYWREVRKAIKQVLNDEGIIMPRPEIFEEGFLVLKLDNGYNIGIEESKVQKIDVLEQYKRKEEQKLLVLPDDMERELGYLPAS